MMRLEQEFWLVDGFYISDRSYAAYEDGIWEPMCGTE